MHGGMQQDLAASPRRVKARPGGKASGSGFREVGPWDSVFWKRDEIVLGWPVHSLTGLPHPTEPCSMLDNLPNLGFSARALFLLGVGLPSAWLF
jgi:hypothetical protein